MPPTKQSHHQEVLAFLQKHFSTAHWEITLPHGSGNENYFARAKGHDYFIKLSPHTERYQALAALGMTPPVLAAGCLEDGASLLVQPKIAARLPSRKDFLVHLEQFARMIGALHNCPTIKALLPETPSDQYNMVGLKALARLQQKWERFRHHAPDAAGFVQSALHQLRQQVADFSGGGLVASHNDPCNANWLIAPDGTIYLIDLESLALEDPALDLGAILWWYYPPELRPRFLEIAGYTLDEGFQNRMRVRMAMHCLDILLPREGSYDRFEAAHFEAALTDFKAALKGEENPQGYNS